jgi:hypothetical protein
VADGRGRHLGSTLTSFFDIDKMPKRGGDLITLDEGRSKRVVTEARREQNRVAQKLFSKFNEELT